MILSSLGIDVYCVDLLGWGYTQLDPSVLSYSARAKVEALRGLWEVVGGNGEVVVGRASLGGAAVIEYAADVLQRGDDNDYGDGGNFVRGTVLLNAQGFVDGIGPMSYLPVPIARLGIRVLKSELLHCSANRMSYYDVESYAMEDALRVGRLHMGGRDAQLHAKRGIPSKGEGAKDRRANVGPVGMAGRHTGRGGVCEHVRERHARRDVALDQGVRTRAAFGTAGKDRTSHRGFLDVRGGASVEEGGIDILHIEEDGIRHGG